MLEKKAQVMQRNCTFQILYGFLREKKKDKEKTKDVTAAHRQRNQVVLSFLCFLLAENKQQMILSFPRLAQKPCYK